MGWNLVNEISGVPWTECSGAGTLCGSRGFPHKGWLILLILLLQDCYVAESELLAARGCRVSERSLSGLLHFPSECRSALHQNQAWWRGEYLHGQGEQPFNDTPVKPVYSYCQYEAVKVKNDWTGKVLMLLETSLSIYCQWVKFHGQLVK